MLYKALLSTLVASYSSIALAEKPNVVKPNLQIITELSNYEIWKPVIFHNKHLWVAQLDAFNGHVTDLDSFKPIESAPPPADLIDAEDHGHDEEADHKHDEKDAASSEYEGGSTTYLHVYRDNESRHPELMDTLILNHSASHYYAMDDKRLAILGRTSYPFYSGITVVELVDNQIVRLSQHIMPEHTFAVRAHYHTPSATTYFSDPGNRAIQVLEKNFLSPIPSSFTFPDITERFNDELWVQERASFKLGDERLSVYNLVTQVRTRIPEGGYIPALEDFKKVPNQDLIFTSNSVAKSVSLVDMASKKIIDELAVEFEPYSIAVAGQCLVTTNGASQSMGIFKVADRKIKLVELWDISHAGDRLKSPRTITYDMQAKNFYVKSHYTCPTCTTTQSSVWRVTAAQESKFTAECLN